MQSVNDSEQTKKIYNIKTDSFLLLIQFYLTESTLRYYGRLSR